MFKNRIFPNYDRMSFVDVGLVVEISVDAGKSVDVVEICVDSVVTGSVGTEGRLQNVVGTEDDMQHFLDSILCDLDFPAATAQASAVAMALHIVHTNSFVGCGGSFLGNHKQQDINNKCTMTVQRLHGVSAHRQHDANIWSPAGPPRAHMFAPNIRSSPNRSSLETRAACPPQTLRAPTAFPCLPALLHL